MKTSFRKERLFVAFELPEALRPDLTQAVQTVRECAPEARVVKSENLHLTLRFLGDVDRMLKEKTMALLSSHGPEPEKKYQLAFDRFTFFRGGREATLVASFKGSPDLIAYVDRLNRALDHVGFPSERRRWQPHATIARRVDKERFDLSLMPDVPKKSYPVQKLTLYLSEFTPHGMCYTPLQTVPFTSLLSEGYDVD